MSKVIQQKIQCLQMRLMNCILFSKKYTGVQNCPLNTNSGDKSPAVDLHRQVETVQSDNEFLISDLTIFFLLLADVSCSIFCILKISCFCDFAYISKKVQPTALKNGTSEGVKCSRETEHAYLLPCQRSFLTLLISNKPNLFYTAIFYSSII